MENDFIQLAEKAKISDLVIKYLSWLNRSSLMYLFCTEPSEKSGKRGLICFTSKVHEW